MSKVIDMSGDDGWTNLLLASDGSWARRSPLWLWSFRPPGQCRLRGSEADLAYVGPADIDHEVLEEDEGHRKITEGI